MTTPPAQLLVLAKQGNTKALSLLLNRALQPQGITARVRLQQGCLQVMLEAATTPDQAALVAFVHQGVTKLEFPAIQQLKVYGKASGEAFPAWIAAWAMTVSPLPLASAAPALTPTVLPAATHPTQPSPAPATSESAAAARRPQTFDYAAVCGVAGALILFLGASAPLISLPGLGTLNYFAAGPDAGMTLLLLVIITLILILKQQYRWLWSTGLSAFLLVLLTLVSFQLRAATVAALVEKTAVNEWTRVPDNVIANLQIKWQWGCLLLLLGASLVITAALTQQKQPDRDVWLVTALTPISVVVSSLLYVPLLIAALGSGFLLTAARLSADQIQTLFAVAKTTLPVPPVQQVAIGRGALVTLGLLLLLLPAAYTKVAVNEVKAHHWQTAALRTLDSVNSEQKMFYLAQGHFALNFQELGLELPRTNEPYQYEVLTQDQSATQVTATAQHGGLQSYTGGVWGTKTQTFALLCATEHATQTPPKLFQAGQTPLECPAGALRVAAPPTSF